jgi:hypothetical protein
MMVILYTSLENVCLLMDNPRTLDLATVPNYQYISQVELKFSTEQADIKILGFEVTKFYIPQRSVCLETKHQPKVLPDSMHRKIYLGLHMISLTITYNCFT